MNKHASIIVQGTDISKNIFIYLQQLNTTITNINVLFFALEGLTCINHPAHFKSQKCSFGMKNL